MTDDAHDGGSRSGREILAATWDQLALLVGFSYLIAVTVEYPDSARQFPLVFLVAGFCFLAVQFVSELLPPVYGRRIKTLTQGMANEMDVEDILFTFVGIAYLVGFIYAVPVVILGSVGLLGYRDWQTGVIATVIVTTAIYLLFGRVLNVPVAEGIYEIPILGGLL